MNDPEPTTPAEPGSDPPPGDPAPAYPVLRGADECAAAEGLHLPRRRGAGRRGVLLVDRPRSLVYLLDADDDDQVFRGRARRPLAGDPESDVDYPADGTDNLLRAADEYEYDVIAAPWADSTGDQDPPATGEAS